MVWWEGARGLGHTHLRFLNTAVCSSFDAYSLLLMLVWRVQGVRGEGEEMINREVFLEIQELQCIHRCNSGSSKKLYNCYLQNSSKEGTYFSGSLHDF